MLIHRAPGHFLTWRWKRCPHALLLLSAFFFKNLFGVKKASLASLKISKTTSLKAKGKKNAAGHWEMFVSGSE